MGARLQSDVSSGVAGEKGDEQSHVETNAGPPVSSHPNKAAIDPASQFEQVAFDQVRGSPRAGHSLHAGAPDDAGSGPSFAAQAEARGHSEFRAGSAGNNPVRSKGRSTTEADRRPLSTAGP
jgi:hypothetical protein